ncbi:unnamed protein product [Lampetra planeri]
MAALRSSLEQSGVEQATQRQGCPFNLVTATAPPTGETVPACETDSAFVQPRGPYRVEVEVLLGVQRSEVTEMETERGDGDDGDDDHNLESSSRNNGDNGDIAAESGAIRFGLMERRRNETRE